MRSSLVLTPLLNIIIFLGAAKGSLFQSRDVSREEALPNTTSNATTQRAHPLKTLHITCDGSRYGWDLQERSCINILSVMEEDPHIRTFGPRGFGPWDFPLPQRLVSSKSIKRGFFNNCSTSTKGDGRCTFTIAAHTGIVERASMKMVYDAAEELVHACVSFAGERPEGGIATGIGMVDRLCLL